MINKKIRPAKQTAQRKLLRAAADAFAAQGFDAASTRSIADRAGVNIALIAYHFGGKEGLFEAVLDDWVGPLREAVERELVGLHGAGRRTDAVVTAFLRHALIVAPGVAALIARESVMAGPTATTRRTAAALRPIVELLEELLPTCDTTLPQGAEVLALLLRLAAPMPSVDGDGAKNYHRARVRVLSILRQGGASTQHERVAHKGEEAKAKHLEAPLLEHPPARGDAPRGSRTRHGQAAEHTAGSSQVSKDGHRTRHTPPEAGMDFVD